MDEMNQLPNIKLGNLRNNVPAQKNELQYGKLFKPSQVTQQAKFNFNMGYNNEPDIKNTIL